MGKTFIAILVALSFFNSAQAAKKTKASVKKPAHQEYGYEKCSNENVDLSIKTNPNKTDIDIFPSVIQIAQKNTETVTAQVGKKRNSGPKEAVYFSEQYDLKLKISANGEATMKIRGSEEQNLKCL